MLEEGLLLQTFFYSEGGQFGGMLDKLSQLGFFSYVLPFLLLFAMIYGILLRVKIFEKNAINGIIALVVSLLALQFDAVPRFFADVFPRLGVGLAVILVILIVMGLFLPNKPWVGYLLFGISALVVIVILYQSAGTAGSEILNWFENYLPLIIGILFIIIIIAFLTREKKESALSKTLGEILPHFKYPQ